MHNLLNGPRIRPPPFKASRKARSMKALAPRSTDGPNTNASITATAATTAIAFPVDTAVGVASTDANNQTTSNVSAAAASAAARQRVAAAAKGPGQCFIKRAERLRQSVSHLAEDTDTKQRHQSKKRQRDRMKRQERARQQKEGAMLIPNAMLDIDTVRAAAKASDISQISSLTVDHAHLAAVDSCVLLSCAQLTELDLSFNRLTVEVLEPALMGLRLLAKLRLNSNAFTRVPKLGRAGVHHLRELYIQDNQIEELTNVAECRKLTKLWAYNNKLSGTLLHGVLPAASLTSLDLSNNALTNCDALQHLVELRELMLNNNALTSLPNLSSSERLDELQASGNRLTSCRSLGCPPRLSVLIVSDNAIAHVCELPTHVTTITSLEVCGNAISSIKGLASILPAIEWLDISANALTDRAETLTALAELNALEELYILLNPVATAVGPQQKMERKNGGQDGLMAFRRDIEKAVPKLCFIDLQPIDEAGDGNNVAESSCEASSVATASNESPAANASTPRRTISTSAIHERTALTLEATDKSLTAHRNAVSRILEDAKAAINRAGLSSLSKAQSTADGAATLIEVSSQRVSGADQGKHDGGSTKECHKPERERLEHTRIFSRNLNCAPRSRYRAQSEHFVKSGVPMPHSPRCPPRHSPRRAVSKDTEVESNQVVVLGLLSSREGSNAPKAPRCSQVMLRRKRETVSECGRTRLEKASPPPSHQPPAIASGAAVLDPLPNHAALARKAVKGAVAEYHRDSNMILQHIESVEMKANFVPAVNDDPAVDGAVVSAAAVAKESSLVAGDSDSMNDDVNALNASEINNVEHLSREEGAEDCGVQTLGYVDALSASTQGENDLTAVADGILDQVMLVDQQELSPFRSSDSVQQHQNAHSVTAERLPDANTAELYIASRHHCSEARVLEGETFISQPATEEAVPLAIGVAERMEEVRDAGRADVKTVSRDGVPGSNDNPPAGRRHSQQQVAISRDQQLRPESARRRDSRQVGERSGYRHFRVPSSQNAKQAVVAKAMATVEPQRPVTPGSVLGGRMAEGSVRRQARSEQVPRLDMSKVSTAAASMKQHHQERSFALSSRGFRSSRRRL